MSPDFLPIATGNDLPENAPPPLENTTSLPVDAAVANLADALTDDDHDPTFVRIGTITSISDPLAHNRVQTDISGTSWLSRTADASLRVADRVWLLQQGPVFIVGGRLSGTDAFTPLGAMVPYAGSSAAVPAGWLLCDGAAVSRTTYAALFAVISTTYGAGNGTTTFNVPSLTNRAPVGSGGTYTRGQTGGASTVVLTDANLSSHSHSLSGTASSAGTHNHDTIGSHTHGLSGSTSADSHSHSVGNQNSRSDILAGGGTTTASTGSGSTGSDGHSHSLSGSASSGGGHTHADDGSHSHSLSGSVGATGSDSAHENMPPFLAIPYIIRAL